MGSAFLAPWREKVIYPLFTVHVYVWRKWCCKPANDLISRQQYRFYVLGRLVANLLNCFVFAAELGKLRIFGVFFSVAGAVVAFCRLKEFFQMFSKEKKRQKHICYTKDNLFPITAWVDTTEREASHNETLNGWALITLTFMPDRPSTFWCNEIKYHYLFGFLLFPGRGNKGGCIASHYITGRLKPMWQCVPTDSLIASARPLTSVAFCQLFT